MKQMINLQSVIHCRPIYGAGKELQKNGFSQICQLLNRNPIVQKAFAGAGIVRREKPGGKAGLSGAMKY
ncbi:hypothetical protein HQ865_09910 [Mucilaginibacter mali]|uniref:Uncharacterized protein n=1 Tax=Mucilaginibacter mali TaxID=2740462 RepID=A0A7D4UAK9_9SPHI|nr:hypothetical protein [Mucilaginibacter mali]QKJ30058.1 hypothetical protein HQ865_09910 [Mucilaginibacter mali]